MGTLSQQTRSSEQVLRGVSVAVVLGKIEFAVNTLDETPALVPWELQCTVLSASMRMMNSTEIGLIFVLSASFGFAWPETALQRDDNREMFSSCTSCRRSTRETPVSWPGTGRVYLFSAVSFWLADIYIYVCLVYVYINIPVCTCSGGPCPLVWRAISHRIADVARAIA